jgi:hypothetical protein
MPSRNCFEWWTNGILFEISSELAEADISGID